MRTFHADRTASIAVVILATLFIGLNMYVNSEQDDAISDLRRAHADQKAIYEAHALVEEIHHIHIMTPFYRLDSVLAYVPEGRLTPFFTDMEMQFMLPPHVRQVEDSSGAHRVETERYPQ